MRAAILFSYPKLAVHRPLVYVHSSAFSHTGSQFTIFCSVLIQGQEAVVCGTFTLDPQDDSAICSTFLVLVPTLALAAVF